LSKRNAVISKVSLSASHDNPALVPPYLSYKTFHGFIERLRARLPLPNRIDRSVMAELSGSNQSQLAAALRYLQLIGPSNSPTGTLVALVKAEGADYQKTLRALLISRYTFLFDSGDLRRLTPQDIHQRFATVGASGETIRRCTSFLLAAARHAQIPVSAFVTHGPNMNKRKLKGKSRLPSLSTSSDNSDENVVMALLGKLPDFDPAWPAEIKSKWLDAFGRLLARVNEEVP
jgi:hypothetical protein